MKHLALAVSIASVSLLFSATDCWAHGGQYRGGSGELPPGLVEPNDALPPAPPDGADDGDGPTTEPTDNDPGKPPVVTPSTPSEVPPAGSTPTDSPMSSPKQRVGKKKQYGMETWNFWYHYNNHDIENLKKSLYTPAPSNSPLIQIGGNDIHNRSDATHKIDALVRNELIKTLKWAMNKDNCKYSDARSAAYIAAGKVATTPAHIELLKKGLDPKENTVVKQSAALAYGVLRRASKARQFSATELSKVRDLLFRVFENEDDYDTRTRSFAIQSIGLLGDQPFSK